MIVIPTMVLRRRDCCGFFSAVLLLLVSVAVEVTGRQTVDVRAGGNATLRCVVDPDRLTEGNQLQWHRIQNGSSSVWPVVAIATVYTADFYSVEYLPEQGRFDLVINNADYDKHNADYDCYLLQANDVIHIDNATLTVLYPPSTPSISLPPANEQSLIEGDSVVINCSSVGGSPSPSIKWFQQRKVGGYEEELSNTSVVQAANRHIPTVSQLNFTPTRADNGAVLRCVVWNRFLSSTESLDTVVKLGVNYFPRVTIQPPRLVRVQEGGNLRLNCEVDAQPSTTAVRWTFLPASKLTPTTTVTPPHSRSQLADTAALVGTRRVHSLTNAQTSDAGLYTCSARNTVGEGRAQVRVQVMYAPRVSVDRSVVDAAVGDVVVVECRVDAQPPADRVYWQRVGDGVSTTTITTTGSVPDAAATTAAGGGDSFYMEGSQLRLVNVQGSSAGLYMCVAVNALANNNKENTADVVVVHKSTAVVAINVKHAPGVAHVRQVEPTAVLGHQLTLTCSADPPGYPEPTYRWWRRTGSPYGGLLLSGAGSTVDEESLAVTSTNWSVARLQEHHAGEYWCRAENALGSGSVSTRHTLVVNRAPRLDMSMQPSVVREAGPSTANFHLSCSASGRPAPTVDWLKNGRPILIAATNSQSESPTDDSETYRIDVKTQTQSADIVLVRSTLTFAGESRVDGRELGAGDIGRYTCRFSNTAGSANSSTSLLVKHAPVVRHTESRVGANLADTAQIQCRVQSYPAPRFRWTFGGRVLMNSNRVLVESGRENDTGSVAVYGDDRLANVHFVSTLILRDVSGEDYGEYACLASNSLGQTSARLQLQPKSGPSPPRQLKPAVVAGSWVQLVWVPGFDGGYRNTEYRVSLLDDRQREMERDCGVTMPCNITELQPQTTYRLRIVAQNNGGRSKPSEQIQFTTLTDPSAISRQKFKLLIDRSTAQMAAIAPANTEGLVAVFDMSDFADSAWRLAAFSAPVPISGHTAVLIPDQYRKTDMYNGSVRVRFCSVGDLSLCSEPILAVKVAAGTLDVLTANTLNSGSKQYKLIARVGGSIGCLLLLIVSFCWFRCRRRRQLASGSSAKLSDHTVVTKLPPYYPPGVLEKQTVSPVIPSAAVGTDKSAYAAGNAAFDYGQPTSGVGEFRQVAAPVYTSGTENGSGGVDSQNGGSLNSQHSLWHVRAPTALTNGCENDPSAIYSTEHQPHSVEYPAYISYAPAGQQQPSVYQHQQYQPADYPIEQHQIPSVSYSAYPASVNGVDNFPDAVHMLGVPIPPPSANITSHAPPASVGANPAPPLPTMGFDESMESGFSTPNQSSSRRVIREIVV